MYNPISSCLACSSNNLLQIFNFGNQTLANESVSDPNIEQQTYPLSLNYCSNCTHLQLGHAVNPDILFKDYKYMSGISQTMNNYYDWFVDFCKDLAPTAKTVLEIACNDGAQLDKFKAAKFKTYGIDPAQNLHPISSANHTVVCDYLTQSSIASFDKTFDLIVAQNVLAHTPDPKTFLELCAQYLRNSGYVLVQTSQADMVKNVEFDTVYHEHMSFFSAKSMMALAESAGLLVVDIVKPEVHGTSFLFVLAKKSLTLKSELLAKHHTISPMAVDKYKNTVNKRIQKLQECFTKLKGIGHKLVGYGAAAKGITMLNVCGLTLDYIVDDTPTKQGLYTSGGHIPIVSFDTLKSEVHEKLIVVPLAWNFYDEIKQKLVNENIHCGMLKIHPGLSTEII